jgi:hypothetical protein
MIKIKQIVKVEKYNRIETHIVEDIQQNLIITKNIEDSESENDIFYIDRYIEGLGYLGEWANLLII